MVTRNDILNRRGEILAVAARNGAFDVRVFGSMAQNNAVETSDLDLLVRFEPGRSLMDWGMLVEELQELLGIPVDVVEEAAMRDRFQQQVMREAIPL